MSPFAGFPEDFESGFEELYHVLPAERKILFATRHKMKEPQGWELTHEIEGRQFVFNGRHLKGSYSHELVPLNSSHVDEMIALARLTKPGPFGKRTIEFGHYYGVFQNERLAAMTGQRLRMNNYTEISAVCTHPDYLGRGYAAALVDQQLQLICNSGNIPFLHVRADNSRAIGLYERLGFIENGPMNFYFLKRK